MSVLPPSFILSNSTTWSPTPPPSQIQTTTCHSTNFMEQKPTTISQAIQEVLDTQETFLPATDGTPFNFSSITHITYDFFQTEQEWPTITPENTRARFGEETLEVTSQGTQILHYKGEEKKQKAIQLMEWYPNGQISVVLPLLCSITCQREGRVESFSFVHHLYTNLQFPTEPRSETKTRLFKRLLLCTLIHYRHSHSVEIIKNSEPPPSKPQNKLKESKISFKGFTKKSTDAPYQRIRQDLVSTIPYHEHEVPKDFESIPLTFVGPAPGETCQVSSEIARFRESCLNNYKGWHLINSGPKTPTPAFPSAIPDGFNDKHLAKAEIEYILDTFEELSLSLQELFDHVHIDPQTKEPTYILNQELTRQLQRNQTLLETLSIKAELQQAEEATLRKRDELLTATPEEAPLKKQEFVQLIHDQSKLEEKYHTNKEEVSLKAHSLFRAYQEELLKKQALDLASLETTSSEPSIYYPRLIEKPGSLLQEKQIVKVSLQGSQQTKKQIELLQRENDALRHFLSDRLFALQSKYEEVQKSKTVLAVLISHNPQIHSLVEERNTKSAFDPHHLETMGRAIQDLEQRVRSIPLHSNEERDELQSKPVWQIPPGPSS